MSDSCEIIVVGGGSAGCVLAHELVVQRGLHVTLIEPASAAAPAVDRQRPARWLHLLRSVEDWDLPTSACDQLAGRAIRWPRGRGLGGSSRINAMIWLAPTMGDLQRLEDAGGENWALPSLEASIARIETLARAESPRWLSEPSQRFLRATAGLEGAEPMIYRRTNRQGRRWTPAELLAGLERIQRRPGSSAGRLTILRGNVARLLWRGPTVCGVQIDDAASGHRLHSRQGVFLCAGAIGTPTLLMRSGVGPPQRLRELGIDVRIARDAVGRNLQDHLIMPVIFRLPPRCRFPSDWSPRDVARWQHLGGGPLASNLAEVGGWFDRQRVQIHVTPTHYLSHPQPSAPSAMTLGVSVTQPQSRGSLTIDSPHAAAPPRIEPGYLSDRRDLEKTVEAVRLARSIVARRPLKDWLGSECLPGAKRRTDAELAKAVGRYAQTLYHPVGTCAMGTGTSSVVDPALRVRGAEKLWIVDASVLPSLTVGNPSALLMALAIRAAEITGTG